LPELAAALGAASCVLHRSDICDNNCNDEDNEDDDEEDASRRRQHGTPDASDAGRCWRIALADGSGDNDANSSGINHRRLPMLSVKGGANVVLENPFFRLGLVQIAKICFYCQESKSVIGELSKVLREHNNLKGLALKVCLPLCVCLAVCVWFRP
jgi:hypothetical protein